MPTNASDKILPKNMQSMPMTDEDHAMALELFHAIDVNGDGSISLSELYKIYPHELANKLFEEADTSHDGKISKKEWDDFLQKTWSYYAKAHFRTAHQTLCPEKYPTPPTPISPMILIGFAAALAFVIYKTRK